MAIYNGAIKVIPCRNINIPQPGIVQVLGFDLASSYDNTGPQPIITALPVTTTELLVQNNISGGDVIYLTDVTGPTDYILQIEYIDVPTNTIVLTNTCNPPAGVIAGPNLEARVYKGNYMPTDGLTLTESGYTGAGNSEGYSLYAGGGGTMTVLTVNNDLLILPVDLMYKVLDLQVVKVLEVTGTPEIWAFKVQQ